MLRNFLFICLTTFTLVSCKKDWVCECTTNDPMAGPIVTKNELNKKTEKDAERTCNDIDESNGASSSCILIGFK